jgi:hypothetical protein
MLRSTWRPWVEDTGFCRRPLATLWAASGPAWTARTAAFGSSSCPFASATKKLITWLARSAYSAGDAGRFGGALFERAAADGVNELVQDLLVQQTASRSHEHLLCCAKPGAEPLTGLTELLLSMIHPSGSGRGSAGGRRCAEKVQI